MVLYIYNLLRGYKMEKSDLILSQIDDKLDMCENQYIITNTYFLDINQQSSAIKHLSYCNSVKHEFYGGFLDAERKIIVFIPDYIEDFKETDNPIVALRIDKDNFSSLTHRDYLGALMGLGIKRQMIGDIFVDDKGCTIAVLESVSKYIIDNLLSVGRGTVRVTVADSFAEYEKEQHFIEKRCYVASMRVDAVISSAFGISRTMSCDKIRASEVFVNDVIINKPDYKVEFGSKVVIRGKGKVIIKEDAGITKKGRQAFIALKYI